MGLFFLFNGILSFKLARAEPIKSRVLILAALASIIAGLMFVIIYPFNPYRQTLVGTDFGRYVFGVIVIIMGLLECRRDLAHNPRTCSETGPSHFRFLGSAVWHRRNGIQRRFGSAYCRIRVGNPCRSVYVLRCTSTTSVHR